MATLEQELMADFADSDGEELENEFLGDSPMADGDDNVDIDMVDEEATHKQKNAPAGIRGAQTLLEKISPILEQIQKTKDQMPEILDGESIEENPEYQLLGETNEFSTQIDGEIQAVHKYIIDNYNPRFPFLHEYIKNPVAYAQTVLSIKNGPLDDIKTIAQKPDPEIGSSLQQLLDKPLLLVVILEGKGKGRDLNEAELAATLTACKLLLNLHGAKGSLTSWLQSRMNVFAPNLTALVGSLTAAQLISACGGLRSLSSTPSCNLASLGTNKTTGIGLATNTGIRNMGYLYYSEPLQTVRPENKKQGMRILSAKVVLAARCDSVRSSLDGSTGADLKEECERRIDKLLAVNKDAGTRALPAPDDKPSRKRGGRRARKAKEATAMTEIRKAQNRMVFGKEEKEVGYGDSVKGMGMIGATDTGRLRAQQIDPKTRAKLSKKNPGWGGDTTLGAASSLKGFGAGGTATSLRAQGLRTGGVGLGSAGTNSIAFTPVQGLELVDPRAKEELNRKRKADEDRWFKGGSFTQLGGASKVDAGGFKVPALPNKKPKTDS
jgi:U4/U6 small nuclear ribonucleoprotein PRP31